ncbi:MAG TPA: hypothetical protein VIK01_29590 [Polyangiaceae bacterium]
MAREQKGQLYWLEKYGWHGRWYATVEGERVRISRCLHTENKAVARRKLARLIAEGNISREEAQRPETFEEAARRVLDEQKAAGMVTHKDRLYRLETYSFPTLAKMQPSAIKASHVRSLLEEARNGGKSRQTLIHIKNDVSVVLAELWRAETLPENVCLRVQVPEALPAVSERSKKERAVLTDDELMQYLTWQHPDVQFREAVLERQVMACVARMFGGLRTSDLHAVRWEGFDLVEFSWGYAPRKKGSRLSKGGKPQMLTVPELLRPILAMWWAQSKRPADGLMFPTRKGAGAGKGAREHTSHAEPFRRDLKRAFGLETWNPKLEAFEPTKGREPTARELTLFTETDYSKPVDFHSWRRAFNQALADAGVNSQTSMALSGHSTLGAHEKYLRNSDKQRVIPIGALPLLGNGQTLIGKFTKAAPLTGNSNSGEPEEMPLKAVGHDTATKSNATSGTKPSF